MSKSLAAILLAIVTILWSGWSFLLFMGQTLGDCRGDDRCFAVQGAEIGMIGWQWLAIEFAAIFAYLFASRSRES